VQLATAACRETGFGEFSTIGQLPIYFGSFLKPNFCATCFLGNFYIRINFDKKGWATDWVFSAVIIS
jgi:hypothetical protein